MPNIAFTDGTALRKQHEYVDSVYYQNCYLCDTEIIPCVATLVSPFSRATSLVTAWAKATAGNLPEGSDGEMASCGSWVAKTVAEPAPSGCLPH